MAGRIGRLRERYVEIHARGLFPARFSVTFSKLPLCLSRAEELEHFEQVRRLSRECFDRYRGSVRRMLAAAGARSSSAEATRAAAVIWAARNGAFLLMRDEEIFRDVIGLETARLLEETFEFQLAAVRNLASAAAVRPRHSNPAAIKPPLPSVRGRRRGRRIVKPSRGAACANWCRKSTNTSRSTTSTNDPLPRLPLLIRSSINFNAFVKLLMGHYTRNKR